MSTEKFSKKAEQYAKGRPDYPEEVIDYIKTLIDDGAKVADIGAGTGKLTELLAKAGYEVFAVEPNADMYAQLSLAIAKYPNVKTIFATSEKTTLAYESIDLITVAQALHWFNLEEFEIECKRILKPNGWIIALYNNVSVGNNKIKLHDKDKNEIPKQAKYKTEATDIFFINPIIQKYTNPISYTRESWLAYMMSHSHSPLPAAENYNDYVRKVNEIFDYENKEGFLHRVIITTIYAQQIT